MINHSRLERIIREQAENFQEKDAGTDRDVNFKKYLKTSRIVVVSGIRRSGKSTLLRQFSRHYEKFYYLNFDDERLVDFSVSDFQNLMLVFQKQFPSKVIFLDEIQNVEKWERFARRIFEEGYKIFITGSNAKLLSSELATHLTGRYCKLELYPFSFKEFLRFKKVEHWLTTTRKEAEIMRNFDSYLEGGGFPEYLKNKNREALNHIFEDIVYRDLLARFKIREVKNFKLLVNYLFTNFTAETSYNSLKKWLGIKSATTVKNYIEFMQESYLVFELLKYDFSLKKQYVSNKKIYVIDNGMRNTAAFSFSKDSGKLLENMVFLELRRRGGEIFYYKGKKECDFLKREGLSIKEAIQVAESLDNLDSEKREVEGLWEAMERFGLKKGLILTRDESQVIKKKGKSITIKPVYQWLLEEKKSET